MLKRMIWAKNSIGQQGDTIIEVLISIAIVSLVLAGGYAITNRNLSTTQDTQEHGQALLIVQQQIEGLRALASTNPALATLFPSSPSPAHCVDLSGAPAATSGAASCNISSSGVTCAPATATAACYMIVITQINGIYTVAVSWASVNGNTSKVSMDYGI